MESKRKKCRLWWPINLSSAPERHSQSLSFFFGWFIFSKSSSEPSVDIVVAFAVDYSVVSSVNLQGILRQTNGNMPLSLQDKCMFSLVGYCAADFSCNGLSLSSASEKDNHINSTNQQAYFCSSRSSGAEKNVIWSCGCHKVDGLLEQFRLTSLQSDSWFQLVYSSSENTGRKLQLIPKLHHMHWNGETLSNLDLHVIIYEIPTFSGHHYSLGSRSLFEQVGAPTKKPTWIEDLHKRQPLFDLDTVIMAINCVNAAKIFSQRHLPGKISIIPVELLWMFTTFTWKLLAMLVASFSTFLYFILQFGHLLLSCLSRLCVSNTLANVFRNTWTIIEIRCCQFLYWPVCLQNHCLRSQSCVEYAEKVASSRHSTWSSLMIDVVLGNLFGIALWSQAEPACLWVSNFANDITNYLLRSGCVWLMGNPAGFKLNTELARVLGMMSLDVIQIWSTFWSYMVCLFVPISKAIALSGILFGLTAAAALIIDMISLITRHVFILHWLLSLLYSRQIQALAALCRLFRGRKWNPLRKRLDSYDYTVEQHVVGSLLFTPLLLLLPTTSAFYTFFSIVNTAISFSCVVIVISIYVIHSTPYNKIFLWLLRRRRFPAGIWFEFVSCQKNVIGPVDLTGFSSGKSSTTSAGGKTTVLVSFLQSNCLNLGELIGSNYEYVYSSSFRSSIASSAYGILTGKRRVASIIALHSYLPSFLMLCLSSYL